jgi:hypothetical protein
MSMSSPDAVVELVAQVTIFTSEDTFFSGFELMFPDDREEIDTLVLEAMIEGMARAQEKMRKLLEIS